VILRSNDPGLFGASGSLELSTGDSNVGSSGALGFRNGSTLDGISGDISIIVGSAKNNDGGGILIKAGDSYGNDKNSGGAIALTAGFSRESLLTGEEVEGGRPLFFLPFPLFPVSRGRGGRVVDLFSHPRRRRRGG